MGCITVSVEKRFQKKTRPFSLGKLVRNWTRRNPKKYIFDKYVKTGKLSKDENKFCERIDWHPVDELPLRKEFIQKMKKATSKPSKKMNTKELEQWLEHL